MRDDTQLPEHSNCTALIHYYDHLEQRKLDFSGKQWETVKYFTTLISALISVTIAGMVAYYQFYCQLGIVEGLLNGRYLLRLSLSFFSSAAYLISWLGLINLRRETRRLMETNWLIGNLEFSDKFPEIKHFTLERWKSDRRDKCFQQWMHSEMWGKAILDPTYRGLASLSWPFYVLIALTLALCIVMMYWAWQTAYVLCAIPPVVSAIVSVVFSAWCWRARRSSRREQEIIDAIESKVDSTSYDKLTIGTTDNPECRKSKHKSEGKSIAQWEHWKADTETIARKIEKHFLDKGMKNDIGGGEHPTYVYVF